uniref:Uncharacterized protein n=1 Tax=Rhizophora mucronata TaxID=61149 RepID=A0A2P2PPP7_RHIMU
MDEKQIVYNKTHRDNHTSLLLQICRTLNLLILIFEKSNHLFNLRCQQATEDVEDSPTGGFEEGLNVYRQRDCFRNSNVTKPPN